MRGFWQRYDALAMATLAVPLAPVSPYSLSPPILRHPAAPQPVRLQAARTLDDILAIIPRHLTTTPSDLEPALQPRVLGVPAQQIMLCGTASS